MSGVTIHQQTAKMRYRSQTVKNQQSVSPNAELIQESRGSNIFGNKDGTAGSGLFHFEETTSRSLYLVCHPER
ncbi:MAG: hypothetical protein A2782_01435 [Candidatus Blackburnbacteria bacterium RIFCSPHIGHO2_01_FULL_43_15b]|uniref:Uncharacterized protein n=1 Tax=Candidatus Blackburnbacteria bacterium RIFCSPHIGHO2_01_FULL_43_15b TaxID=1797513 RepID=A0A1G1UXF3_9BACT|nr:MAG: hypothetical protein A2782_01435 [Candidatus Blackburnbacteria bacterium RIFCSPHIGHO2_01_FULL_43_15b]